MSETNPTIGAYMQVYKNDGKAEFAWKNFRKFYPESPAYLVSDNGDDFTKISDQYKCEYEHSAINVGVRDGGYTIDEMMEWLGRLERSFLYCGTDFILYMEDDVYVRGMISPDKSKPLAGLYANAIPQRLFDHLAVKYPNATFNAQWYGACGGTIYDRAVFLDLMEGMRKFVQEDMMEARSVWNRVPYLDCAACLMYMCLGRPFHKNDDLVEPARNKDWETCGSPIVHFSNDVLQKKIMEGLA